MKAAWRATLAGAAALSLLLAGCGRNDDPNLMNIRKSSNGPDEFGILPPKPLQMPESLASLPPPTPGGINLTDPTPEADAITALGGKPGAGGSDAALVAQATRFGVASGIRSTLAAEDLEYRRNNDGRLLERVFAVNVYFKAYAPQSLDQYAELARWRRLGAATPSAPPQVSE
ncbi:Beta-barrel assembly machine subunit BamF [Gemmobacter aquatilis]|uniref:Beta-barrel assembly machine subunit BamF n=1 Tax=Gemmobacter aquatilis TaxID=933059 RepID=A0A1H7ZY96_9RHOB|nr:DUF3035 domain-containing protein [Gemmobacter aquatilis]SEM62694.1 Beta-barrel assembly machine subunit BamF [Gemmobacter aquatilis]